MFSWKNLTRIATVMALVIVTFYINKRSSNGVSEDNKDNKELEMLDDIIKGLGKTWETYIFPVLQNAFDNASKLYAVFYLGNSDDEVIMEIWDPEYIDIKPSKIFALKLSPSKMLQSLPHNRSGCKVFVLENWNKFDFSLK